MVPKQQPQSLLSLWDAHGRRRCAWRCQSYSLSYASSLGKTVIATWRTQAAKPCIVKALACMSPAEVPAQEPNAKGPGLVPCMLSSGILGYPQSLCWCRGASLHVSEQSRLPGSFTACPEGCPMHRQ